MSDTEQRWHATYATHLHPEGLTREQVPEGHGACDALVIASLIYPSDGSFSSMFVARDGRTKDGELSAHEQFKAWSLWAGKLATSLDPGTVRQQMAQLTYEMFLTTFFGEASVPRWRDENGLQEVGEDSE